MSQAGCQQQGIFVTQHGPCNQLVQSETLTIPLKRIVGTSFHGQRDRTGEIV